MFAKKLLAIVIGLLAGLLLCEVLLRLTGVAPEVSIVRRGRFQLSTNPRLGYEPVPNLDYAGESLSFFDYRSTSNRLGYRDRDHSVDKPDGSYRIVVLGDSIAAGLKVERFEETFPAILEAELRQAGLMAEVINLGVSGYNSLQEVEALKKDGLRFRPDVVLLAFSLNDAERVDGGILARLLEDARESEGIGPPTAHPYLLSSAFYRWVRFSLLRPDSEELLKEHEEYLEAFSEDTVALSFQELGELAIRDDFEVLVVVFPILRRLFRYRFSDQHEEVRALSAGEGFWFLDLLPAFQQCRQNSNGPVAVDRLHPSASGHRCAAEAMARFIEQEVVASSVSRGQAMVAGRDSE